MFEVVQYTMGFLIYTELQMIVIAPGYLALLHAHYMENIKPICTDTNCSFPGERREYNQAAIQVFTTCIFTSLYQTMTILYPLNISTLKIMNRAMITRHKKRTWKGWSSRKGSDQHLKITTMREQEIGFNTGALLHAFAQVGAHLQEKSGIPNKDIFLDLLGSRILPTYTFSVQSLGQFILANIHNATAQGK